MNFANGSKLTHNEVRSPPSMPICVPCLNEGLRVPGGGRVDQATSCAKNTCVLHDTCGFCGGPTDGRRVVVGQEQ